MTLRKVQITNTDCFGQSINCARCGFPLYASDWAYFDGEDYFCTRICGREHATRTDPPPVGGCTYTIGPTPDTDPESGGVLGGPGGPALLRDTRGG